MSILSLPDQTIPESQKTKDWHKLHGTTYAMFATSDHYQSERMNILKYYRGYNAELSPEEVELTKAITCPNGTNLGVEYVVYPLIQTKVEQILGEYLYRPLRRKAYAVDKKSKNKKFEEKLKMVSEEIMRDVTKKLQGDLGFQPETENPDMYLPEDIEEFFEKDFKMHCEDVADKLLALFLDVRKEKHKFKELFLNYLISDRAHAVLDKQHGHTTLRSVHPLDADYDLSPYKTVQDNHEYFFEHYWLTENEIYNTFPSLTKEEKQQVKEMFESIGNLNTSAEDSDSLSTTLKADGWYQTKNNTTRLRLVNAMWKSRKRVSIKKSTNKKTGEKIYKKLNDESEARKRDKVEHIDGEMPRHVTMLGPDLVLSWGVMDQRYSSNENPYECTLPVISIVRDNTTGTSQIKSVAAKLYQLQQIASEVLFEIRLALKHAGDSRVLVYDAAQTPKDFTKDGSSGLNRVMHHLKKDKLMIINSKEKGAGKNTFNQFTSLDMSQKGAIQDLFNGLAIIEDLASKFVGITPEREGQIGQYQTASGTEKAIAGSSARTEVIYTPFDEFVQALLEKALMKMKYDYEENETIQYVIGEMKTKFLKITKDFFMSDFGIYLSDARKDQEAAQRIDAAAEMALSTANTPDMVMGLIEVFEGDSAVEKKAVFGRMLNTMEKMRKEAEEAAAKQAEADRAQQQADKEQEMVKSREDNATEIKVAEIYANNKAQTENLRNKSQEVMKLAELTAKEKEAQKSTPKQ